MRRSRSGRPEGRQAAMTDQKILGKRLRNDSAAPKIDAWPTGAWLAGQPWQEFWQNVSWRVVSCSFYFLRIHQTDRIFVVPENCQQTFDCSEFYLSVQIRKNLINF